MESRGASHLTTLRAAGVTEVPEPFGLNEQGREVPCYLPGIVGNYPMPSWIWTPTILHEAGSLFRRVHDADAPLAHRAATWQLPAHKPIEVVCLNDVAPTTLSSKTGTSQDFSTSTWLLRGLAYRLIPFGEYTDHDVPGEDARPGRLDALIRSYGYDIDQTAVLRTAAA